MSKINKFKGFEIEGLNQIKGGEMQESGTIAVSNCGGSNPDFMRDFMDCD